MLYATDEAQGDAPTADQPDSEVSRVNWKIVEAEACVVRRIFAAYAAGASPRAIAATLNGEGVAPPRGKNWNASTINGNGKRGHGILRNSLYAGAQIWNRVRMVKDPATGRRVSRVVPGNGMADRRRAATFAL